MQPPAGVTTRYYRTENEYTRDAASMAAAGWRVTDVRRAPDATIIATYTYGAAMPPVLAGMLGNRPHWIRESDKLASFLDQPFTAVLSVRAVMYFSNFIHACTFIGTEYAASLEADEITRADLLANDNAHLREEAEQRVQAIFGALKEDEKNAVRGWLSEDLARMFGETAFEMGFEGWCTHRPKTT